MQNTIKTAVSFSGVGLHSGLPARVTIKPAGPECGIVFRRTDCALGQNDIPALWDQVLQSPLCTRIVNRHGVELSTVEHIMAALVGCGRAPFRHTSHDDDRHVDLVGGVGEVPRRERLAREAEWR